MINHPRIFLATQSANGLRTVDVLRRDIKLGWMRDAWSRILFSAEKAVKDGPVLPDHFVYGRDQSSMLKKNPDFFVCEAVGQQLLRLALAHLLTGREEFKKSAMDQLEALYNPEVWPDWIDQSSINTGVTADLRTGSLSQDVAVAFDWLAPGLTPNEKKWIIDGLDRRGIQPFLKTLAGNPVWVNQISRMTAIVSGLGIAGMALDGEHPDAQRLIDIAMEKMEAALSIIGPEGEFNESVNYASANRYPVNFFLAHRYWTNGQENRLAQSPFPEMCRWLMHTTVPPGRVLALGDCLPEREVVSGYMAAVAAATRDGVAQWYYEQYQSESADPYQLVAYDPSVAAQPPDGLVPNFKVFKAHAGVVISRTDWSSDSTACVVFAKTGREQNHDHNDIGQLCVQGFGERLIKDLGAPSGFPADFFGEARWEYYNASISGHNVLMFDRREQRSPLHLRDEQIDMSPYSGRVVAQKHVPDVGSAWKMDLSPAYQIGQTVTRTVIHLYPGHVAVMDEAKLSMDQNISLRWHTCDRAAPDSGGRFVVQGEMAKIDGLLTCLDGGLMQFGRGEHHYHPPYDRERSGKFLELREESFVQGTLRSDRCRILTLFSVQPAYAKLAKWIKTESGWIAGDVRVYVNAGFVELSSARNGTRLSLD